MKDFVFHVPTKVFFGTNQTEAYAQAVSRLGKKAMVMIGGGSAKKIGAYDDVVNALHTAGVQTVDFSGIKPNPLVEDAEAAIAQAKAEKVDLIVAIGGGSVIDTAKLVAAGARQEQPAWNIVTGQVKVKDALPLAVVLTLSATGSEMDSSSVLTNADTTEKFGWGSPLVLPAVTLENPAYTTSVNAWHTAAGTADIMSHVMEQYFSLDEESYLQDAMSEAVLRTAIHFGPQAIAHPDDLNARANLMWASSWALNGLLSTGKHQPWSVHDIEHELSAEYDLTHGIGLAILTPHWLRHVHNEATRPRIARFAREVFGISSADPAEQAEQGIQALSEFFASMKIPMTLHEVGIDATRFEKMAEHVTSHRGGTIKGFQPLAKDDVLAIYQAAL